MQPGDASGAGGRAGDSPSSAGTQLARRKRCQRRAAAARRQRHARLRPWLRAQHSAVSGAESAVRDSRCRRRRAHRNSARAATPHAAHAQMRTQAAQAACMRGAAAPCSDAHCHHRCAHVRSLPAQRVASQARARSTAPPLRTGVAGRLRAVRTRRAQHDRRAVRGVSMRRTRRSPPAAHACAALGAPSRCSSAMRSPIAVHRAYEARAPHLWQAHAVASGGTHANQKPRTWNEFMPRTLRLRPEALAGHVTTST